MKKIAVLIHITHVTGIVPSVHNTLRCKFGIAQVAFHHQVSFDQDLSHLTGFTLFAGFQVLNFYLHIGDHLSDTSGFVEFQCVCRNHR